MAVTLLLNSAGRRCVMYARVPKIALGVGRTGGQEIPPDIYNSACLAELTLRDPPSNEQRYGGGARPLFWRWLTPIAPELRILLEMRVKTIKDGGGGSASFLPNEQQSPDEIPVYAADAIVERLLH